MNKPTHHVGMPTTVTVDGMTCGHCEQTVEDAAIEVEGVSAADADREANEVDLEGEADLDAVVAAINEAGYDAAAR